MSSPLGIGHAVPPVRREFEPPDEVDWSLIEDPQLRGLLQESSRRRDLFFEELWSNIVGAINWAGPRRKAADGRLYVYHEDAGEWLSYDRHILWAGLQTPPVNALLNLATGVPGSATAGYYMPQDATFVRWWGMWTTAAPVGMRIYLGTYYWGAAGGETSFSEDLFINQNAGTFPTFSLTGNTGPTITNLLIGAEIAWRTTFPA